MVEFNCRLNLIKIQLRISQHGCFPIISSYNFLLNYWFDKPHHCARNEQRAMFNRTFFS